MSNFVFVLDAERKPLSPCHPSAARKLLREGKAAVLRRFPFTIILQRIVVDPQAEPVQLKIDPGSKVSGLALVQGEKLIWGAELVHRGQAIQAALQTRRNLRRSRRTRKTRYRQPRFLNRRRHDDWLAPSLMHRVLTIQTWVQRLRKFAPICGISMELVRFDTQALETPEIEGAQYQQGTLYGFEIREYLLEKWGRQCAYCGAENVRLEIEHIHPKSKGGSDRISNLCIACHECNQKKGERAVEEFLTSEPQILAKVKREAKLPLKDAAAINTTRWKLWNVLQATGLVLSPVV